MPHSSDVEFTPEAMCATKRHENATIMNIVCSLTFVERDSSLMIKFLESRRVIRAFDCLRSLVRIT